jgi:polar amino acid transport system permease protein
VDGRLGGRAGASLKPDRRAVREAARRRRAARGAAISALSTVVVLGALATLILTSKGWPTVRETFFDWGAFKDSFPGVL